MGFDEWRCRLAVMRFGDDADGASMWLINHGEGDSVDGQTEEDARDAQLEGASNLDIDRDLANLREVYHLGFDVHSVDEAVATCKGDLHLAVASLFQQQTFGVSGVGFSPGASHQHQHRTHATQSANAPTYGGNGGNTTTTPAPRRLRNACPVRGTPRGAATSRSLGRARTRTSIRSRRRGGGRRREPVRRRGQRQEREQVLQHRVGGGRRRREGGFRGGFRFVWSRGGGSVRRRESVRGRRPVRGPRRERRRRRRRRDVERNRRGERKRGSERVAVNES